MKLLIKILKILVSLVVIIIVAGSLYISYETTQQLTHLSDPNQSKTDSLKLLVDKNFDFEAFQKDYQYKEKKIPSSFQDHHIPFASLQPEGPSKGTVIMAHGLGGTKESIYPQAKIFLDMGYHVLAYDQRNSGDNSAPTNTFGVYESKDMIDMIHYAQETFQPQSLIVWGESFGGATATLAVAELGAEAVDYIILDSPMNDGKTVTEMNMAAIAEETGMPLSYLIWLGDIGLKVSQGVGFQDAQPSQKFQNNTTPLLVIHSKTDSVIPYEMGKAIYDASASPDKHLHTVEKGDHVMLVHENPKEYTQVIKVFLEK